MTSSEIAVSIIAGLFALYALLITLGSFYDRRKFTHRIEEADKRAATTQENSGCFSRAECLHQVDQGLGRAIYRIRSELTDERVNRFKYKGEPSHYCGAEHSHIARGFLGALNILEEETGRYKKEEEEPYLTVQVALCALCGKQATGFRVGCCYRNWSPGPDVPLHSQDGVRRPWPTRGLRVISATASTSGNLDTCTTVRLFRGTFPVCSEHGRDLDNYAEVRFFAESGTTRLTTAYGNVERQSQEADRQRRHVPGLMGGSQYVTKQEKLRQYHRQPTAPLPGSPPPLADCKVCGAKGYTYRWGQCLTTWYSDNYKQTTRATVDWQKFDSNYSVGWFPVCAHHAAILDKHSTVARETLRHTPPRYPHRTGGTPPMQGRPRGGY